MGRNRVSGAQRLSGMDLAGIGRRFKAFVLDYLIILLYVLILSAVNYGLILAGGALERLSPAYGSAWVKDGVAFLTLVLPVILYFTVFEGSSRQATWGKRKLDLRVVGRDGEGIGYGRAFLRNLLKFLPWQIAHTSVYQFMALPDLSEPTPFVISGFALTYLLVGLYALTAFISRKRQAPYDWVAGTFVVAAGSQQPAN